MSYRGLVGSRRLLAVPYRGLLGSRRLLSAVPPLAKLPGRLGTPAMKMADDPRVDPRCLALMQASGLSEIPRSEMTSAVPYQVKVDATTAMEGGFTQLFGALVDGMPPITNVTRRTETIEGVDGNEIKLYVSTPTVQRAGAPCIYHIHGGAMMVMEAKNAMYSRWRDELAARGAVVVGVEFRNSSGVLGPAPFPAGLNDCMSGLRWTHEQRATLGVSKIVVSATRRIASHGVAWLAAFALS